MYIMRKNLPTLSRTLLCCVAALSAVIGTFSSIANIHAEIPGLSDALSTAVIPSTPFDIVGPPSSARDIDTTQNSVEIVRPLFETSQAVNVFQALQPQWLSSQHPDASLAQIGSLVSQRYKQLVIDRLATPNVTQITVEPITLVYPTGYYDNDSPVTVNVKRLTLEAPDRTLVAYYANYDKLQNHVGSVIFQINGHFGTNPSRLGLGLEQNGGLTGAALGKIAMQGYPLLTYDDHNVGESSAAADGLPRTLENIQMIDRTLLTQFDRVDALGISGGAERLFYTMPFFESSIQSVYYAGWAVPLWTRLVGDPFGSDADTHDQALLENFTLAELALVGLARGVETAFAHNAYEGGKSKYGFFEEIAPALQQYSASFLIRGDDRNGDGLPDYGPGLAHEYDLHDYLEFLQQVRAVPEPATSRLTIIAGGLLLLLLFRGRRLWPKQFAGASKSHINRQC